MSQRVLLVDDSASIRNIIKIYLMNFGFEFVEAETGERALQLARLVPPSLIILDVNMPGMDGITMLKKLRAEALKDVREVPVILLTGEKGEDLDSKAGEAGANAVIRKPVTSPKLIEAVKGLVRSAKA